MQKRVKRLRAAEPWEVQPRSVPCTSPHVEGVELPQCQNLLRNVLVRPDFTDNLWHILGFLDCSGVCFARQVCKTWKRTLDETSRESEHWLSFSSAFRPFQYLRPETSCELLLFSTVLRNETLAQRCFDTIVGEFYKGAPSPHSAIPSSSACKAQACSPTCCCVPILACCALVGVVYRRNTAWGLLDATTLEHLLRRDNLMCISEMDVFEALLKWSAQQARHMPSPPPPPPAIKHRVLKQFSQNKTNKTYYTGLPPCSMHP